MIIPFLMGDSKIKIVIWVCKCGKKNWHSYKQRYPKKYIYISLYAEWSSVYEYGSWVEFSFAKLFTLKDSKGGWGGAGMWERTCGKDLFEGEGSICQIF